MFVSCRKNKRNWHFGFVTLTILCDSESLLHNLNGIWFGEYKLRANLACHDSTPRVIPKIFKSVTPKPVTIKEMGTRSYAMVVSSPACSNDDRPILGSCNLPISHTNSINTDVSPKATLEQYVTPVLLDKVGDEDMSWLKCSLIGAISEGFNF